MRKLDDQEQYTTNAAAMIRAIDNTGIRMFMYYPQTKHIIVPENTCAAYQCSPVYENMPYSFAEDYVHPDDYDIFYEIYFAIDRGEKTATATFHSKDFKYCNHVTLTTVTWFDDGRPDAVFGLIEDESDLYHNRKFSEQLQIDLAVFNANAEVDEALKTIASAISSQYFAVYYIWLDSRKYVCFQEKLKGVLSLIGEKGDYEEAWDKYINDYIAEEDQAELRNFVEISTLAERIGRKSSISLVYRRKEVGWARGQFIAGKRLENGIPSTVIYTVTDINEEIENKLKKQEAEQESLHDSMTGLWNRKAFEQFKESDEYGKGQIGLMLFDIDRFKSINDQYGHEKGDQVIKVVADQIRNILRQNDLVFRMGGDEFAVLLHNCSENAWNSICRKIAQLHSDIKSVLSFDLNVTVSVGLCTHEDGYLDDMYTCADKALYNTKANGRGGCTLTDLSGKMLEEWHDNSSNLRKGDILERNSTVTWGLDIPKKPGLPIRAYGDELFMSLVAVDKTISPEETYRLWLAKLEPDYLDVVRDAIKAAIGEGRSEVVYKWKHPEKGVLQFRCSASLDSELEDYYKLVGYVHVTTGTHVFTLEDVSDKVRNAMEEMYFCNFYIRLGDRSFRVYKAQPYMMEMLGGSENASDVIEAYIRYMVADDSKETMKAFFDLDTLQKRLQSVNFIGVTYSDPNIGRARARFIAVDRNEEGSVETVSLIVETIE